MHPAVPALEVERFCSPHASGQRLIPFKLNLNTCKAPKALPRKPFKTLTILLKPVKPFESHLKPDKALLKPCKGHTAKTPKQCSLKSPRLISCYDIQETKDRLIRKNSALDQAIDIYIDVLFSRQKYCLF